MRKIQYTALLILSYSMAGCAITSGLQTYDLPNEGFYQTDLGTQVNVIKLTQESLFAVQSAGINLRQEYAHLFSTPHRHYSLSPGDILSISLWAYPEISGSEGYQIDQSGYIHFPMIGRYKAVGKSLTQINLELRSQLSRYLKTPDVIVRVLSYQGKYYSIQGSAGKGGIYYLTDQPVSLYNALGMAGGIGDNASINLIRQGRNYSLNTIELEKAGYSLHNLLIQPNDTIYVNARENHKIYVMGESGKNQALQMRAEGMNLTDVLGESLGINPFTANRSKIYVLRSQQTQQTQQMTEIYQLDLSNIGDFGLASQFKMRSNDIVYVDATGLVRWQRIINQIVPFSNTISSFGRLGE